MTRSQAATVVERDRREREERCQRWQRGQAQAAYAAFLRGDMDALPQYFDPDVVWHIPGRSAMAGTIEGSASVLATLSNVAALIADGTVRLEVHDLLAGRLTPSRSAARADGELGRHLTIPSVTLIAAMIAPPSVTETNELTKPMLKNHRRIQASARSSKAIAASASSTAA
jgi:hypothetical protein